MKQLDLGYDRFTVKKAVETEPCALRTDLAKTYRLQAGCTCSLRVSSAWVHTRACSDLETKDRGFVRRL